jgi:hypothetical protein
MNLLSANYSGKPGQPKINQELKRLKAQTWFKVVAEISGKSAYELEKEFCDQNLLLWGDFNKSRPRLWEKYKSGKAIPKFNNTYDKKIPTAILVEKKYPNTIKWLNGPLWDLANIDHELTMTDIKKIYASLPQEIRNQFIHHNHEHNNHFWRKRDENEHAFYTNLASSNSPIAFITLLCAYREFLICQDKSNFEFILKLLVEIKQSESDHEPIPSRKIAELIVIACFPFFPLNANSLCV